MSVFSGPFTDADAAAHATGGVVGAYADDVTTLLSRHRRERGHGMGFTLARLKTADTVEYPDTADVQNPHSLPHHNSNSQAIKHTQSPATDLVFVFQSYTHILPFLHKKSTKFFLYFPVDFL
jgi:hypothetical protein